MNIKSISDFRTASRIGQYAWPGGYECYYLADDGEALCVPCVNSNRRAILDSIHNGHRDGWRVVAFECSANVDEVGHCAHCDRNLNAYEESAQ